MPLALSCPAVASSASQCVPLEGLGQRGQPRTLPDTADSAPCALVGRKRLFARLVDIIAEDHGLVAHYAGACARGVAQFWQADRGVRIEPDVLRRASVPTLQVLAAHELGHAWSARRLQALPLHLPGAALVAAGAALGVAGGSMAAGVVGGLAGLGLLGHLLKTHENMCALIEEVRADWFALNAGCTPGQLEDAFEEAARLVDRPLGNALALRTQAARRACGQSTKRGALVFLRGWVLWLPRPRRRARLD